MAISDVSLSLSARSNLLALQNTSKLLGITQERLSTGLKVNTAIDNATAFFASQSFLNRANDLSRVKENLSSNLQTVKAASNAIDSITKIVEQAQGLTTSALQTSDTATRSAYATQFNDLRTQIDALVNDAVFNGTNLLDSDDLTVNFNEDNSSTLTVSGVDASTTGLSIAAATSNFSTDNSINTAASALSTALATLRTFASSFGNAVSVIQTRQDFTDSLINSLQTASDNLILADLNEEGANLQALQARQQLGVVALGISGQQSQAILRLF
ncbi:MAG: flagellin [Alphaproteobacteria bacterium]|nr:flagellin [Alphaproteobacteria bacterium]